MSFEFLVQDALNCMCIALGEAEWEGDCCIAPSRPAFDQCCETGGVAWGIVTDVYPTTRYPNRDSGADVTTCATTWAVSIELGAITCVCFDMCDCEVRAENATKVLTMAEAAMRGLICCYGTDTCPTDLRIGAMTMIGPDGGCGGFTITATLSTQLCCPEGGS